MTHEMERAEKLLLKESSTTRDTTTSELLKKVAAQDVHLSGDTVRSAYWHLVNDGKLERTDSGVRKAR